LVGTPYLPIGFDTGFTSSLFVDGAHDAPKCEYLGGTLPDQYGYNFTVSSKTVDVVYQGSLFGFLEMSSVAFEIPEATYGPKTYADTFSNSPDGFGSASCNAQLAGTAMAAYADMNTWKAQQEAEIASKLLDLHGSISYLQTATGFVITLEGDGEGSFKHGTAFVGPVPGPAGWSFEVTWTAFAQGWGTLIIGGKGNSAGIGSGLP
jgi:hypothetical protein